MSNIDYIGNADKQLKKYDSAIKNINSAIEVIEQGIGELNAIVGFNRADELKISLRNKISYLSDIIKKIKNEKSHIYNRSRDLQRMQSIQNELNEKK